MNFQTIELSANCFHSDKSKDTLQCYRASSKNLRIGFKMPEAAVASFRTC